MSLDVCVEVPGMVCVFQKNITHNLTKMADAAGIYKALWRPEEIEITKAGQLIPILEAGLALLKSEPDKFKAHNPENGWGTYEGLVEFVEQYLAACREFPEGKIAADR